MIKPIEWLIKRTKTYKKLEKNLENIGKWQSEKITVQSSMEAPIKIIKKENGNSGLEYELRFLCLEPIYTSVFTDKNPSIPVEDEFIVDTLKSQVITHIKSFIKDVNVEIEGIDYGQ